MSRVPLKRLTVVAALVLAWVLVVACVLSAAGAPAGHIAGTVTDDTTHLPLANVIVTVFDHGSYVSSVWTDSAGHYTFDLGTGTYRVVYLDHNPLQIYGEQAYSNNGFELDGDNIAVSNGSTTICDAEMHKALNLAVIVRRAGYPETALHGMGVGCLYRHNGLQVMNVNVSNGDGVALVKGLPDVPAAQWQVSVFDPSMIFTSPSPSPWTSYPTGGTYVIEMDMTLANMGKDVVVSTPKAKSTVKKNKALAFTGTFSKRVTTPKTLAIRAYRLTGGSWRLGKTVLAKVKAKKKYSTYAGSIKLPRKGAWKLVAVFSGNSSYVTTNSGYKHVTVK